MITPAKVKYQAGDTVTYENVDGFVKAVLLKRKFMMIGFQVWQVRVIEITKKASFGGNPKVGKTQDVSERWFTGKA